MGKGVMVYRPRTWPRQNKANSVKQSQLAAGAGWEGPGGRGANAPNKPNSRRSQVGQGCNCAKRTQLSRAGGRDTPLFHYSIIPPFQSDTPCAKQSQLPEAGHRGGGGR
jgi:hypothetical protein